MDVISHSLLVLSTTGINPHLSGWRDKLPIPRLDETTFIHRIFGGYFRSQLKCNRCGYKSNTYDPFLDLALEVSKKHINSLSAALIEFTRTETLDSQNRWNCPGCKNHVCPTKHLSIFRPPLSLCIHFKRFGFEEGESFNHGGWAGAGQHRYKGLRAGNRGSKISKKIDFPACLNLPLSDGRVCQYLLTGVIIHVGNSATTGHYTSFVKQPGASNQWCYMDDSYVEAVSEKTVLKQRDAYVLFYTRKDVNRELARGHTELCASTSSSATNVMSFTEIRKFSRNKHEKSLSESRCSSSKSTSSPRRDHSAKSMKGSLGRPLVANQRKTWNPHEAKHDKASDENVLLGNITVGNWHVNDGDLREGNPFLRYAATKESESVAKSKKRKLHLDFWDSLIDEVEVGILPFLCCLFCLSTHAFCLQQRKTRKPLP